MWSLWEDKMLSCKLKGKKELWVGQWYKKIAPLLGYFVLKRERERERRPSPLWGGSLSALPPYGFLRIYILYKYFSTSHLLGNLAHMYLTHSKQNFPQCNRNSFRQAC